MGAYQGETCASTSASTTRSRTPNTTQSATTLESWSFITCRCSSKPSTSVTCSNSRRSCNSHSRTNSIDDTNPCWEFIPLCSCSYTSTESGFGTAATATRTNHAASPATTMAQHYSELWRTLSPVDFPVTSFPTPPTASP